MADSGNIVRARLAQPQQLLHDLFAYRPHMDEMSGEQNTADAVG
jgi:hypothetical protein